MTPTPAKKNVMQNKSVVQLLILAACILFTLIVAATAVHALSLLARLTVDGYFAEGVLYLKENLTHSVLLTACAILAFLFAHAILQKMNIRIEHGLLLLWLVAALAWVIGVQVQQNSDPAALLQTAYEFAEDDFRDLTWGYYMGCPFQLGMVLLLEIIIRMLPSLDGNIVMQCMNCVFAVTTIGFLTGFAQYVSGEKERTATLLLLMTCLPLFLFTVFVYGTLLMLMLCSISFLLFAKFIRSRRISYIVFSAVLLALACQAKQNAMIAQMAMLICCVLFALQYRDWRPVLIAAASIALDIFLGQIIVWQYELRSGIQLIQNESKLTWLVMGLSEGGARSGWYNGYVGRFFDRYLTREAQLAEVKADLADRLKEMASDPAMTAAFMKDKWLSQWLEPTYSTIARNMGGEWYGRYNGVAEHVYRSVTYSGQLVLGYMNTWQKCLYIFSTFGGMSWIFHSSDRRALEWLILPVTIIGGFLFHQLFEAKSQYIFPYMIYLIPVAAHGLCQAEKSIIAVLQRLTGKSGVKRMISCSVDRLRTLVYTEKN